MRCLTVLLLVVAFASSSACMTQSVTGARTASSRLTSDCPELEGYPDCQDGHRVDLSRLSQEQISGSEASGTAR